MMYHKHFYFQSSSFLSVYEFGLQFDKRANWKSIKEGRKQNVIGDKEERAMNQGCLQRVTISPYILPQKISLLKDILKTHQQVYNTYHLQLINEFQLINWNNFISNTILKLMKRISHFTLDDILKRRTLNSFTKPIDKTHATPKRKPHQQDQFYEINDNEILMNVFEEFKATGNNNAPVITNEVKVSLVEVMAKKLNMKLNATRMAQKLKIKKFQHIQILEKPQQHGLKKKQLHSITVDAKKLDFPLNNDSKVFFGSKKCSYFVLSGQLHIYEKDMKQDGKRKRSYEEQVSDQVMFYNWKQFQLEYPSYKRAKTITQFTGHGPVFSPKVPTEQQNLPYDKDSPLQRQNTNSHKCHDLTIAQDALIVQIQNPEFEDEYLNLAGMDYQKMAQIIQNFSIFNSLGKKIRNFVQFFELKQYQKNQEVYAIGDSVNKFYLLLKGQVVFESNNTNAIKSPSASPKQSRKNSIHIQMNIKTEMVSSGNYFGQEQMIFNLSQRLLTAKCKSSKCQMLQISKQKFQKMLEYSDFHDCIKKGAEVKFRQRLAKLQKNKQIRNRFVLTQFNEDNVDQNGRKAQLQINTVPIFGGPKKSLDGRYKVMHGQVIRQFTKQQKEKMGEDVHFSMLKVNPDMYDKTVDKFRKYNIKPREKYVPDVNWELKRVWKVLNLENVLRQQAQVTSPEGRKFYDSHKRYVCHIKQSKSLRPKTSSSTYRTKLQYIAYLQKFKGQK